LANLDILLGKLVHVKPSTKGNYKACCPAHDDKEASLSVKQEGDKILLKCFAGCTTESIIKAINLDIHDLFIDNKPTVPAKETLIAEYSYTDEQGKMLYQVCRFEPKNFRQRHRNGGNEWVWNMDGVIRVPYHLREVTICYDDPLYHVEGEKDADNLMMYGRVATTTPGGANGWRIEYAKYYCGKKVVIIPDNDSAGYEYAKDVVRSIIGKAREIKIIILPKGTKDISEWLEKGNDPDLLPTMEQDIDILLNPDKPTYTRDNNKIFWNKQISGRLITFTAENVEDERTGLHARTTISCDYVPLAWSMFNIERSEDRKRIANQAYDQLRANSKNSDMLKEYTKEGINRDFDMFCAGLWDYQLSYFVPESLTGDPEQKKIPYLLHPYIMEGGGTILYAPPGRGKSYSALLWAISIDAGCHKFWDVVQKKVLFINLERSKESLRVRLANVNTALGLPPTRPLLTLNARGKSLNGVLPICRKYIKDMNIQFVVLDSISRAGYGDLNENQPMNKIIDALSSLAPSWMALSHTSRANEEHAYGSIMLDAGADICVQLGTEIKDDGTLGVGYQITKQNDSGYYKQDIYALEFGAFGLTSVRQAKSMEFPEIESKNPNAGKRNELEVIMDYILNCEGAESNATRIAEETMIDRTKVSRYLTNSGKFVSTTKRGREVFYGVKSSV
jgi:hypothetical protein